MKKIQLRKYSMYLITVSGLFDAPQAVKDAVPKFGEYLKSLEGSVDAIGDLQKIQERDTKGTAVMKDQLEDKMILSALGVSRRLGAYAIDAEDNELEHLVDYSQSDLERSADTVLKDRCMVIYEAGVKYLEKAAIYGLKKPMLEVLLADIEAFKAVIPKPREKVVTKKGATDELAKVFASTDTLLKKMDKVFEMLRTDYPDFYRTYKNNRLLTDPGFRRMSVVGKVVDEKDTPVANVVITVTGTDFHLFSGDKGGFGIQTMEAGSYDFVFKKNGYLEQRVRVDVNDGERTEVDVVLKK